MAESFPRAEFLMGKGYYLNSSGVETKASHSCWSRYATMAVYLPRGEFLMGAGYP